MALINCPECQREISDTVKACPHCGYVITGGSEKKETMVSTNPADAGKSRKVWRKVLPGCIIVGIIVICVAAFIAVPAFKSPVKSYLSAIKSESYEEAKTVYNSDIKGKLNKEAEFEEVVNEYIKKIISDYQEETIDFKTADSLLNTIVKSEVMVTESTDAFNEITALNDSRIAYESAVNYENESNYEDAILQYNKVIKEDEHFKNAQEKITSLKQQYKTNVLTYAKALKEKENYFEAINVLTDALSVFPGDPELKEAYNRYETQYINQLRWTQEITVEKAYLYTYGYSIDFYGLTAVVKNNSSEVVKDFEIGLLAYDKDGYPLNIGYNGVLFKGNANACNIQPEETYGSDQYWNLSLGQGADIDTVIGCVERCTYYDDSTWENPYYQYWLDEHKEKPLN